VEHGAVEYPNRPDKLSQLDYGKEKWRIVMSKSFLSTFVCLVLSLTVVAVLAVQAIEAGKPDPKKETGKLCSDGEDNDGDGLIDLNDPDCSPDAGGEFADYCGFYEDRDYDIVWNDIDQEYCDGVDKVMIGSDDIGFRKDTFTAKGKKVVRFVDLDLTAFNLGTGLTTVDMRFQRPPGGLSLHEMCYGSCPEACFMGAEGGFDDPLEQCDDGVASAQGMVGFAITFNVDGVQKSLEYGTRSGGTTLCRNLPSELGSRPVIVNRLDKCTWTIEGEYACLCLGCGSGNKTILQGRTDAAFLLTIEENGCTP
jgi:hypothetical protein